VGDVPDPVAWTVVEPGWKVFDASGEEVGHVAEVLGDANRDIFDGLHVTKSLLSSTDYVPSERVAQIREGEVHLS
jgi:rRNA processing protein Gar1